ncbi:MAG: hypothetical protein GY910_19145 [bacterium]|nr:hypothetical protein [Deltaproteobacteria bacterium]MCP4907097.1 hypothetical protein [bacterium]
MDADVEILETRRGASKQFLDDATRALFERGIAALERDCPPDAVQPLREAHAMAPDHAQIRSLLGLAIARVDGEFSEARMLCEDAAKQEFFNPELYLNLALVYLHFGRRSEALRYLRRGQMIDPGHRPIQGLITSLGRRRIPILPFLPRRHPVNRALGTARDKVMSTLSRI